jgi:hypothetical protein
MAMLDWNDYRSEILARVGEIGKLSPDTVKGYMTLGGAGAKTGHLDGKIRELIALAVAISLRCDGLYRRSRGSGEEARRFQGGDYRGAGRCYKRQCRRGTGVLDPDP